ncbi:dTDP-4-dehydrorhamnose 3,5-epimerase [Rubellimicrobium roseum]|uniref:dTDP-4-dehydrorhamnose 3,5-epimerase n=1 Tax=Rubellimicrobium roseum TaxID=687525 RepID=A0A5C4NFN3_9RHOB|nr:dTDP-4-dehydrorhamnose 3,5-epimerase [Rubellimicrobium roseum]TNC73463.1 dTDP-4-dehydrorhamnose 3,5-epimerase [Rubellimicrobium roseum]
MNYRETTLKDAWILDLEKRGDDRGWFARTFDAKEFEVHGMDSVFVQQNASSSARKGTLRGLHFQRGADSEAKLVRCLRGAIVDVIVDLRRGSPSYMKHEAFELSAGNGRMLYVPRGFAHGFQTLTDDVEVSYLVSAYYAPQAEGGLRYDDPRLGIVWPLPVSVISPKDANWPLLDSDDPDLF